MLDEEKKIYKSAETFTKLSMWELLFAVLYLFSAHFESCGIDSCSITSSFDWLIFVFWGIFIFKLYLSVSLFAKKRFTKTAISGLLFSFSTPWLPVMLWVIASLLPKSINISSGKPEEIFAISMPSILFCVFVYFCSKELKTYKNQEQISPIPKS